MICYKDKTWCVNDKCRKRNMCKDYANAKVCKDSARSGLPMSCTYMHCEEVKPKRAKSVIKLIKQSANK